MLLMKEANYVDILHGVPGSLIILALQSHQSGHF